MSTDEEKDEGERRGRAPRARNRTVMLTADVASQVRARLAQEGAGSFDDMPDEESLFSELVDGGQIENESKNGEQDLGSAYEPVKSSVDAEAPSETPSVTTPEEIGVTVPVASGAEHFADEAPVEELAQDPVEPNVAFSPEVASADEVLEDEVEDSEPLQNVEPAAVAEPPQSVVPESPAAPQPSPAARQASTPETGSSAHIEMNTGTPLLGFLVSYDRKDTGEVAELRAGRLIVSSEPIPGGPCLLLDDEGVSPMHAIIRIGQHGEMQVLDQLSEGGTTIDRAGEELEKLSGDKATLNHGDIVQFGSRSFYVCLIPRR